MKKNLSQHPMSQNMFTDTNLHCFDIVSIFSNYRAHAYWVLFHPIVRPTNNHSPGHCTHRQHDSGNRSTFPALPLAAALTESDERLWLKVFHWGQGLWFHQVLAGNETVVTCQWQWMWHKYIILFLIFISCWRSQKTKSYFFLSFWKDFLFRTDVNPQNCTTIIQSMTHMILLWSSPLVYGWVRGLK